jgi:2-polyprenyl-6-methoxyphenol hydroxylase-like FAD-dependent oxidoreductase
MSDILTRDRYDVVVAGARVAGAATAMLLARAGMKVLVVDPARRGSDTLSTHALMRAGVLQLHRWGVLDRIRNAGTPRIRTTTFHYDAERIEVDIKPKDGVDGLYAPRRTLIDEILVTAAEEAGAHVVHGVSLEELSTDGAGRVTGASVAFRDRTLRRVEADLVIGADGRSSRVAALAGAEVMHVAFHSTANIFGHWPDLDLEGYHWHFHPGFGTGAIPTNHGEVCVFAGFSPEVFHGERHRGLEALYHEALEIASPELAERVRATGARVRLRAFAGAPGVLRRAAGPGWALVGDAGYFRDPITAHGITDALRDAELLARAVLRGDDAAFAEYGATRDRLSAGMIDVTDRLASLEWSLDEAKELHLRLSREMSKEAEYVARLGPIAKVSSDSSSPLLRTA